MNMFVFCAEALALVLIFLVLLYDVKNEGVLYSNEAKAEYRRKMELDDQAREESHGAELAAKEAQAQAEALNQSKHARPANQSA
jgi:hypothetical protein